MRAPPNDEGRHSGEVFACVSFFVASHTKHNWLQPEAKLEFAFCKLLPAISATLFLTDSAIAGSLNPRPYRPSETRNTQLKGPKALSLKL